MPKPATANYGMTISITSKDNGMKGKFPINRFERIDTPFYYYDTALLRKTLEAIKAEAVKHKNFVVHQECFLYCF